MNDLAWNGNKQMYLEKDNIEKNTNTIIVVSCPSEFMLDWTGQHLGLYLKSLKPIKKGEELSRFYGWDHWKDK